MKNIAQVTVKQMMKRIVEGESSSQASSLANAIWATDPLFATLIPSEVFKIADFDRRFVLSAQEAWLRLAVATAKRRLGQISVGYEIRGTVKTGRLKRIAQVLYFLERPEHDKQKAHPDWDSELAYILEGKGKDIPTSIVCDVYAMNRKSGKRYAFELKSPLPNSDITKVSKEKLLKLYSMEPRQVDEAYFALPYNPFGTRDKYNWSFPARWFDMRKDKVVLIGDEFWDKIGGLGTYQAFIEAVNEIGPEYKNRIYREFLGIEPPSHTHSGNL